VGRKGKQKKQQAKKITSSLFVPKEIKCEFLKTGQTNASLELPD